MKLRVTVTTLDGQQKVTTVYEDVREVSLTAEYLRLWPSGPTGTTPYRIPDWESYLVERAESALPLPPPPPPRDPDYWGRGERP